VTRSLASLGVTVRVNTAVTDVHPERVTVRAGGKTEEVPSHTVLWGAGVAGSPLAALLAQKTGAQLDGAGRIHVNPDLTLPGHPEIFVLGDMTCFLHQTGKPLPGVAPVAMQMGSYAADAIQRRLAGHPPRGPFVYIDRGSMATIGRALAVAEIGRWKLSGFLAWLVWLFIHIIYLIRFENRVMVLFQWAWNYFTRGRAARLITEVRSTPKA
jgi:NADH dehydrogenase